LSESDKWGTENREEIVRGQGRRTEWGDEGGEKGDLVVNTLGKDGERFS
jgi:hypothetical protein